jgi:hypothetical protein
MLTVADRPLFPHVESVLRKYRLTDRGYDPARLIPGIRRAEKWKQQDSSCGIE